MVQFTIMGLLLLELCTCRQSQWSRKQKNRCARTCECKLQVKAEKFSMGLVCSTPRSEGISSCVELSCWLNRTEGGPQDGKPVDAKMRSPPPSPPPPPLFFSQPNPFEWKADKKMCTQMADSSQGQVNSPLIVLVCPALKEGRLSPLWGVEQRS